MKKKIFTADIIKTINNNLILINQTLSMDKLLYINKVNKIKILKKDLIAKNDYLYHFFNQSSFIYDEYLYSSKISLGLCVNKNCMITISNDDSVYKIDTIVDQKFALLEKGLNKFYKFIKEKILDQFDKPVQDNELNNFLVFGKFLLKDEKSKKYSMNNFSNFLEKTEDLVNIFFFKYLLYNITKKILDEKKFTFFQLLFYLATLEPGSYFTEFPKEYYDSSFDKHLEFMNQTGFLIIKTENKNYTTIKKYFCTPLIQTLFENNNISGDFALLKYGDENAYRFLYVETNMKFYAFMPQMKTKKKEKLTSIQLNLSENYSFSSIIEKESKDELINYYIKLLHLMFRIEFILPDNGIIGYITRENIYNIIKHITSSENLLQFLSDHMSLNYDDVTKVKGKSYLINESAVNQILVLENEKKSIEIIKAACFCEFYSSNQYREYLDIMQNENINIIKTKENKNDRVIVIKNFDAKRLGNKLKDIK